MGRSGEGVSIDPLSPDVHNALGMMQAREAQWDVAERSFRRAIELAPREVLWREHFAMFLLLPLGRLTKRLRNYKSQGSWTPFHRQLTRP